MNERDTKKPRSAAEEQRRKKELHKKIVGRYHKLIYLSFIPVIMIWTAIASISLGERGQKWRALEANHKRTAELVASPNRGNIYAASGELLRISVPQYRMTFDFKSEAYLKMCGDSLERQPEALRQLAESSMRAIPKLRTIYKGGKDGNLLNRLRRLSQQEHRRGVDLYGYNITLDEYKRLYADSSLMYERRRDNKYQTSAFFRSLKSEARPLRRSPSGTSLDFVLGGVSDLLKDSVTQAHGGLEGYYNKFLAGGYGIKQRSYPTNRQIVIEKTAPTDGANLYTTFDMELQNVLDKAVMQRLEYFKAYSVTAAVMEVHTGRIVAMACKDRDSLFRIRDVASNHLFYDLLEPGSTAKTMSMMIALDEGFVTPSTTVDLGNRKLWTWVRGRAKRPISDHNVGVLTADEIIANSSNIGIAKLITNRYDSDPTAFVDKLLALGLDVDLGDKEYCNLFGVPRPRVYHPRDAYWQPIKLPGMSYGYDFELPPIYMLNFYSAVANGGKLMSPSLVDKVVASDGHIIYEHKPRVLKEQICKPSTIQALHKMLRETVTGKGGTARNLMNTEVSISGKTGTTRATGKSPSGKTIYLKDEHINSFCGFFPSETPRYAIYVNVNRAQHKPAGQRSSGVLAGEIALEVALADARRRNQVSFEQVVQTKAMCDSTALRLSGGKRESINNFAHKIGYGLKRGEGQPVTPFVVPNAAKDKSFYLTPVETSSTEVMPNLVGMSLEDAYCLLLSRGVKISVQGRGNVIEQSRKAGALLRPGDDITLYLGRGSRQISQN